MAWSDDDTVYKYGAPGGNYNTVYTLDEDYTPPTAQTELVELPSGVTPEDWYAEGTNQYPSGSSTPTAAKVAFDGNDVYVSGIFTSLPNAWIKGTLEGNKVTFVTGQLLGQLTDGSSGTTYDIYAVGTDGSAILNNFSSYVIPFGPNLRLQDVRGKVIVLSRDEIADGYNLGSWADQTTRGVVFANGDDAFRFVVQDYYNASNQTTKQNAIKALLAEARTQTSPNFIFVNHTSGYSGTFGTNTNINNNAKSSNKCALDNINANAGRTGIIMMDHAGTNNNSYYGLDLCNAIIL